MHILTIAADESLKHLHERMPIILDPQRYHDWLDPQLDDPEKVQTLLTPIAAPEWNIRRVSTVVNNARTEGAICIQPYSSETHG